MGIEGKDKLRMSKAMLGLGPLEEKELRARLEKLRGDCGCKVGAFVMVSSTAYWIYRVLSGRVPEYTSWQRVWLGIGIMIGSAAVGKILGLVIARIRFRWALLGVARKNSVSQSSIF